MEKLELKGYWWIPKKRSQRLAGDLTYSPDEGAFLTLLGTFGKRFNRNPDVPKIILGTTQDGKAFTLYNTIPTQISWGITGLGGSKYFAHFVFEGVHFTNSKEIKFHELRGMYDNLDAWVNTFGFKLDLGLSEKGRIRAPSIKYSLPKSRLVELPRKRMVGVTFGRKGPVWNIVQTEANITQETFLVAKNVRGDTSFFDLNDKLGRLADLFQFASQQLASPRNITGFTRKNKQLIGEKKTSYYPPVKIYYQPIEVQKNPKKKTQHDMFFSFKELSNRQISKWFSSYEKHKTQIHLYRSLVYNDKSFIETRFLNIVQALEALHSTVYKSFVIDPKRFELRRGSVIASAPPNLRKWLWETISGNNYKRLKQRILELVNRKQLLFKTVIRDEERFAQRVRATRNQFIHQNTDKDAFENGKELHCAILLLKFLFEAYLLQFMGVSLKRVQKIYERRLNEYRSWGVLF